MDGGGLSGGVKEGGEATGIKEEGGGGREGE